MKKIKDWSSTNPGGRKTKKPSCKSTALKRWMATEMRWNKNWGSLTSPLMSEIRRPKSYRKELLLLDRQPWGGVSVCQGQGGGAVVVTCVTEHVINRNISQYIIVMFVYECIASSSIDQLVCIISWYTTRDGGVDRVWLRAEYFLGVRVIRQGGICRGSRGTSPSLDLREWKGEGRESGKGRVGETTCLTSSHWLLPQIPPCYQGG